MGSAATMAMTALYFTKSTKLTSSFRTLPRLTCSSLPSSPLKSNISFSPSNPKPKPDPKLDNSNHFPDDGDTIPWNVRGEDGNFKLSSESPPTFLKAMTNASTGTKKSEKNQTVKAKKKNEKETKVCEVAPPQYSKAARRFYNEKFKDSGTRLSKVLAASGVASRRSCEELIFEGKVTVNGSVCNTPQVVEAMASLNEKPIILALSNPTSQSECTAEEAYLWSRGSAIFASGSPFPPVEYKGKVFVPGQSNNAYIFPGFGLGLIMSGTIRVHDDLLLAASEALAEQVTEENFEKGLIFPPFTNIRKISAHIAAKVAAKAYELGLATRLPQPKDLEKFAESFYLMNMTANVRIWKALNSQSDGDHLGLIKKVLRPCHDGGENCKFCSQYSYTKEDIIHSQNLNDSQEEVVSSCVGMTQVKFLVIDEAAQLKECESTIPLQLPGLQHCILIGDEKQLPALVKSKIADSCGFGRSMFERLVILGYKKHMLNVQYRMHPNISLFPCKEFYDQKISDAPFVMEESYNKSFLEGELYSSYSFINIAKGKEKSGR
ncbi:unnamed protein product [Vicia faba]|uniref:RNA-binding S4 domain-containing protein n=1 Tax=Vicia faba TaxID=3906 RepID=A0AAV0ZM32_VICFA|nr:unnamed protein product [Vicia faba]